MIGFPFLMKYPDVPGGIDVIWVMFHCPQFNALITLGAV